MPIETTDYALDELLPAEIDRLWREVRPVYARTFAFDFPDTYLSARTARARLGRMRVLRAHGRPVGVLLLFGHAVEVDGRALMVYRPTAAVDAGYRNQRNLSRFMYRHVIPQRLRHPLQRQYIVEGFIHPSVYRITLESLDEVYPSPDRPTPPEVIGLMQRVRETEMFAGYRFDFDDPHLARYPAVVSQTAAEDARWRARAARDRHVRFFFDRGMQPGLALVCVVPVTLGNLARSLVKTARLLRRRRRPPRGHVMPRPG